MVPYLDGAMQRDLGLKEALVEELKEPRRAQRSPRLRKHLQLAATVNAAAASKKKKRRTIRLGAERKKDKAGSLYGCQRTLLRASGSGRLSRRTFMSPLVVVQRTGTTSTSCPRSARRTMGSIMSSTSPG